MKPGEVIIQMVSDLSIDGVHSKLLTVKIAAIDLGGTSGDYFYLFSQ